MALHDWEFKPQFRAKALGWNGSAEGSKRLKSATAEIKKAAKSDPVRAAEGAVYLFGRIWPAFEQIDSSSGAIGMAADRAQAELIPIVAPAPADSKTRNDWLEKLWQSLQDDGVGYLETTADHWGELCASAETACQWADRFIPEVREAWTDASRKDRHARSACMCLSSLLAAGRHQDLWDLLDVQRTLFWPYRRFGFEAYVKEGRVEDALAYAEASTGYQRDPGIDVACEKLLLAAGRLEEAYTKHGLQAIGEYATGLNAFRTLAKKYPHIPPVRILTDLAAASRDCGRYFAAAKDAGLFELALKFAVQGHPDPNTLSRACRDSIDKDPPFAHAIGQIAMQRYLDGFGYEVRPSDWADAYRHYADAGDRIGETRHARAWVKAKAGAIEKKSLAPWVASLLRMIRDRP